MSDLQDFQELLGGDVPEDQILNVVMELAREAEFIRKKYNIPENTTIAEFVIRLQTDLKELETERDQLLRNLGGSNAHSR